MQSFPVWRRVILLLFSCKSDRIQEIISVADLWAQTEPSVSQAEAQKM